MNGIFKKSNLRRFANKQSRKSTFRKVARGSTRGVSKY